MVSKKYLFFPVLVLALCLQGCHPRMAPVSTSDIKYDAQADRTVYAENPYGSIAIPGKWQTGKFNAAGRQQYFYHKDTATLVVSIGACRNSDYGKGHEGYDFVKKYYEMEAKYQTQLLEQTPKIMVENEKDRYMIWMVRQDGIDQYYLCGVKDCACNECTYRMINLKSRKYSADKAKEFLRGMFMNP